MVISNNMSDEILNAKKELVRLVTAGSVDDGKSTLIGRLLYDCNLIYEDQLEAVRQASSKRGFEGIDYSLFLDGLSAEREQGITIDVAYRYFSTPRRKFIVADVPGHEQYTRNMITGASNAQMAFILVDARQGLLRQSKRHLFICSLLGINHILILVNKMDLVGYRQEIFAKIVDDFKDLTSKLNVRDLQFLPISAKDGDMVVHRGKNMDWYNGRTLFDYMENVQINTDRNLIDFRFPVQLVVRSASAGRGYAGLIESGVITQQESILALPSQRRSRVSKIMINGQESKMGVAGQSVVISLADELDIGRGDMIVRENNLPELSKNIEGLICWLAEQTLTVGKSYLLKQTTRTTRCFIDKIHYRLNVDTWHRESAEQLDLNEIGRVSIRATDYLMYDHYNVNRNTGSFIIIDELDKRTVGGGIIMHRSKKEDYPAGGVSLISRGKINKKPGAGLWFTGLSGSGKSTIANKLYTILSKRGVEIEQLDGDLLRDKLGLDLGFSRKDREINIKRATYIAALLSQHGVIVLTSFISPYRSMREAARSQINNFVEIFVNTPLAVCEKRDIKGLYNKARKGEITNFTGISDPYEEPIQPEIELKPAEQNVDECVAKVVEYLEDNGYIEKVKK